VDLAGKKARASYKRGSRSSELHAGARWADDVEWIRVDQSERDEEEVQYKNIIDRYPEGAIPRASNNA